MKDLTLDLNGHTLTTSAAIGIQIADGVEFTLNNSNTTEYEGEGENRTLKGKITYSGNEINRKYGVIQVGTDDADENASREEKTTKKATSTFTMNGGTIEGKKSTGIVGSSTSVISITDGCTVTSSNYCGIFFGEYGVGGGVLNMDGGTVKATGANAAIQVSGNIFKRTGVKYDYKNTTLNISGGTVEYAGTADSGNRMAIYGGGVVDINISKDAVITSNHTGIEFRGGNLNVEGGTITSTDTTPLSFKYAGIGGSANGGVGINIAQHATRKNIAVDISGGNISGYVGLAVTNATGNKAPGTRVKGTNESDYTENDDVITSKMPEREYGELKDGEYFVGTVEVNVRGGTISSNSTDNSESASSSGSGENTSYTLSGVNAIFNGDKRVTINLSGTEVNGGITAMTNGRTGTGYAIGEGNTFSNFVYGENNDGIYSYQVVDGSSETFSVAELAPANWTRDDADAANWKFLYKVGTGVEPIATLAPAAGKENVLAFTVDDSATVSNIFKIDLTNTAVFSNIDDYTTLDASAAGASFALDIKANDKITSILGGAGNDTLTAGAAGTSLNGGDGNDYLIGGDGKDNFIYTAGKDSIEGYTSSDIVSLGAGTAPIDFSQLSYDGNDFIVSLGSAEQVLTFKSTPEFTISNVNYKGNSNGVEHIAQGTAISLGAGYTSKTFDGSSLAYTTIDAKAVTVAGGIKITGSDTASSLFGALNGGALTGGYAGDSLQATGGSTTLDGDYGDDLLIGGSGKDTFIYSAGGADSIQSYSSTNGDLVVLSKDFKAEDAIFSVATEEEKTNISLDFGGGDKLIFQNVGNDTISVQSRNNSYVYTKDFYAVNDKSITLAENYSNTPKGGTVNTYNATGTNYETIDAAAVNSAISVIGNSLNNAIFGSKSGGTLDGGDGDDNLNLTERTTTNGGVAYVLQYAKGKDNVDGFVEGKDTLIADTTKITAAKAGSGKLAFTFSSKSDVLTFKSDNDIEKVSLNGGGYLTKDGVVSGTSLALFVSAKGRIDLTDNPYKGTGTDINSVNATAAKKQSVTLVGGTQGGAFTFADNRKKDLFEYGGENVTISNYEAGKDKINLGNASIKSFALAGEDDNKTDVLLSLSNDKTMSIAGAAGHEVLISDASSKSNSYSKMVFAANGVLHNKEKRPTEATVSTGASNYTAVNSIKKIYVTGGAPGIAITAGNNKTLIDASDGDGVSLYGGNKNDKLIGSTSKTDYFFYSAGKDVIENYTAGEQISLTGSGLDINDAKITLSKNAFKLKFSSKNTLSLKNSDLTTINIDGKNYTFDKNAIGDGGNVSLTSQFSGTYKIDTKDAGKIKTVYGDNVKKNLTFKGTSEAETFTGGQKKTTFKGGGGNDTFIGNDEGKDIFFYAKGDKGDVTIQNFDFTNDKLKIANGTLSEISTVSGGVQFTMKNSKTDSATAGTFKVTTDKPNEVLIKANNTYYWFADSATARQTDGVNVGDLITADSKVSKTNAAATGYAIIELGYSTNLTKSEVAVKAGEFTFNGGITKNNT